MSRFDWLSEYLAQLQDELIVVLHGSARYLPPAHTLEIDTEDWTRAHALAAGNGLRWAGIWADRDGDDALIHSLLENEGDYLVLLARVASDAGINSIAPHYPAADRPERHLHDLHGIRVEGGDTRRWTRHRAWRDDEYPLAADFPAAGREPADPTPPDSDYPFLPIQGAGVYQIPVGPVHAGIIEPGHFRFHAVGEEVLKLEQHLGYVHKGIEKIAVGRDAEGLARLAGRISGDTTVAHAWAACQALERATGCRPPRRAQQLRGLLCERERVANHLGDIGAICNDVGFAFAQYQCARLRELWQRHSDKLFGHRLMMDCVVPGGVTVDLDETGISTLRHDHACIRDEIGPLFDILEDHPSLEDRLLTTGVLSLASARELGCTGHVGKASGMAFDVRGANPYAPYASHPITTQLLADGDVMARMQIRMREIHDSLDWMDTLLGALRNDGTRNPLPETTEERLGIGFVEGWRGEIVSYVRLDAEGRVARFYARDPSWHHWPALERIVMNNIVPDFPVCNKSVNGSYSGQDL